MLNATDVMYRVCDFKTAEGFLIPSEKKAYQTIELTHPERGKLQLNCYGENRDRKDGLSLTEQETFTLVSRAIHGAMCRNDSGVVGRVALAFPGTDSFYKYLRPVRNILAQLNIDVYLVRGDGSVTTL